jgi:Zn-dependent membrane protease YugP
MTIDLLYVYMILPAFALCIICSVLVKTTFRKYSKVPGKRMLSGADVAGMVCRQEGATQVRVQPVSGSLTDHYDPRTNSISLSQDVYYGRSVAAAAVAAHEAGHASQYENGYSPIRVRNSLAPLCAVGSRFYWLAIVLGVVLDNQLILNVGVLIFALLFVFQLVTLPVELNASSRAMNALQQTALLDPSELKQARKVLTAAAMTYVAALALSLAQLLRLLNSSRRHR